MMPALTCGSFYIFFKIICWKNYLYQLASITPSAANVESYAKIVKEKFYMRTLINVSKEIIDSAVSQEDSAEMLLDAAEQKIYDIRQGRSSSAPSKISDIIINEVYTHLEKRAFRPLVSIIQNKFCLKHCKKCCWPRQKKSFGVFTGNDKGAACAKGFSNRGKNIRQ